MSDWDSVTVIKKRAATSAALKSGSAINSALRQGGTIASEKKTSININHKGIDGSKAAKIDRDTEEGVFNVEKVGLSVSKTIGQARQALKLTQKDLATKINEKPSVVNDYESGRAAPSQQILGKLERALGVKLRGKDIGAPLGGPKK